MGKLNLTEDVQPACTIMSVQPACTIMSVQPCIIIIMIKLCKMYNCTCLTGVNLLLYMHASLLKYIL